MASGIIWLLTNMALTPQKKQIQYKNPFPYFWGSLISDFSMQLKVEWIYKNKYIATDQVILSIFEYIET